MSVPSTAVSQKRARGKLEIQLDELLKDREEREATIKAANSRRAAKQAKIEKRWRKDVGDAPEELVQLDDKLAEFMAQYHYALTRRLSKTIKRASGEIRVVLRSIELEMPRNETPVVDFFLSRSGGKRYLTPTWKVNRRALLQAPPKTLALVAPYGVWRGRHRMILVKSPSNDQAHTISQRRFNQRTLK